MSVCPFYELLGVVQPHLTKKNTFLQKQLTVIPEY